MLGAIIGDIVGSRFERVDHFGKDFLLFASGCVPTDDSFMTLAIAKALLLCDGDYSQLSSRAVKAMKEIAAAHPRTGWGGRFYKWLFKCSKPYYSYGNGAGMRVSPVGWVADSPDEVRDLSYKVTAVSHDHPEGLKGAEAVAMAVYLARVGADKSEIKRRMAEYYPILNDPGFCIANIMGHYGYDPEGEWVTCQGSIPQALAAFFDGVDFEDVIRNAVGIGGDSDTIGAMAGSIAEAYYGVPQELENEALSRLDRDLKKIYFAFNSIKKPRVAVADR